LLSVGEARAALPATYADWTQPVIQQDKIWTLLTPSGGTALPGTTPLSFVLTAGPPDLHSLRINGSALNTGITYDLRYSIAIDLGLAPTFLISSAELQADVTGAKTILKKIYKAATFAAGDLIATLTPGLTASFGGLATIWVDELITIPSASTAGTITDTYTQFDARVPEPATAVVWSLLGVGGWLGSRVSRRRQTWSDENRTAIHQLVARGRQ
jgi:hypothetical protein